VFYVVTSWAHVNYICLTGLGLLVSPAVISVTEAVLAQVIAWFGMNSFGIPGLLWGLNIAILLMSAWLFPLLLSQKMRNWRTVGTVPLAAFSPSM
jgi:hypothetical protein